MFEKSLFRLEYPNHRRNKKIKDNLFQQAFKKKTTTLKKKKRKKKKTIMTFSQNEKCNNNIM